MAPGQLFYGRAIAQKLKYRDQVSAAPVSSEAAPVYPSYLLPKSQRSTANFQFYNIKWESKAEHPT